jgi:hypothetical protein
MRLRVAARVGVAAGFLTAVGLGVSASAQDAAKVQPQENWVQLFNGKDLSGWKIPNPPSGNFTGVEEKKNAEGKVVAYIGKQKKGDDVTLWRVENGTIIGGGPASHIFSERGDYTNFRYRVEAKLNDGGNSGQYFRTAFGPNFPQGYEAQLNATHKDRVKTGSLYPGGALAKYKDQITVLDKAAHKPDEFFTQEVECVGNKITISVNGKKTIDFTDPGETFKKGHFALQGHDPGSIMTFRKVEVIELK